MSDYNTGKPDMSDAAKAFNAGVEDYEALVKSHAETLATHQGKAEQAAVAGDFEKAKAEYEALVKANAQARDELASTIAKNTKAKAEHDAAIAERNAKKW